MKLSRCRTCKALKARGDACASCGRGLKPHTLKATRLPICVTKAHGFHAPIQHKAA